MIEFPLGTGLLIKKSSTELGKQRRLRQEEVLRRVIEAEIAAGWTQPKDALEEDKLLSGLFRMQHAIEMGASYANLRLMFRLLRKSIEFDITQDRTVYLLNIVGELSEDEIFILSTMKEVENDAQLDSEITLQKKLSDKLIPEKYSKELLQALLQRLGRTGLVVANAGWDGMNYETSPLFDEVIQLVDLQIFNNINLAA